jgi:uncharacterized membrane protein
MAGQASEYHHGDQDIHAQQATFRTTLVGTKWACLAIAATVLMLTLWFCTSAGFFSAAGATIVLVAVGIFALRSRAKPAH